MLYFLLEIFGAIDICVPCGASRVGADRNAARFGDEFGNFTRRNKAPGSRVRRLTDPKLDHVGLFEPFIPDAKMASRVLQREVRSGFSLFIEHTALAGICRRASER